MLENTEHILKPLPYHLDLRDYLKSQESALWNWFASARAQANYTENLRMALLKSTYRLDAQSHPELYKGVEEAKARLQLDIPVTVYQAQNAPQLNAALYFIPGEGHVVLSGPVLSLLNGAEITSVLGHELAHYRLWQWEEGELHITDRLIQAVASDPRAAESHEQTAQRFQLYTEIFADRGSLCVTRDVNPVVAGLIKIETGLSQVSALAYLKQAEEIFAKDNVSTESLSHPEAFIRARAVSLWDQHGDEAHERIVRMIEGTEVFDCLDLIARTRMQHRTRQFLEHFLQPKWFQTSTVLGHAMQFFPNFQPATQRDDFVWEHFKTSDPKTREYLCYLMLDFVTADPELDDLPLVAALDLSRKLELESQFEKLATKELKLKVREVRKLREEATKMLATAGATA